MFIAKMHVFSGEQKVDGAICGRSNSFLVVVVFLWDVLMAFYSGVLRKEAVESSKTSKIKILFPIINDQSVVRR